LPERSGCEPSLLTQNVDVTRIGDQKVEAGRKGMEATRLDLRAESAGGAESDLVASMYEGPSNGKERVQAANGRQQSKENTHDGSHSIGGPRAAQGLSC